MGPNFRLLQTPAPSAAGDSTSGASTAGSAAGASPASAAGAASSLLGASLALVSWEDDIIWDDDRETGEAAPMDVDSPPGPTPADADPTARLLDAGQVRVSFGVQHAPSWRPVAGDASSETATYPSHLDYYPTRRWHHGLDLDLDRPGINGTPAGWEDLVIWDDGASDDAEEASDDADAGVDAGAEDAPPGASPGANPEGPGDPRADGPDHSQPASPGPVAPAGGEVSAGSETDPVTGEPTAKRRRLAVASSVRLPGARRPGIPDAMLNPQLIIDQSDPHMFLLEGACPVVG